ncbi:unnamed protein product [Urochloa humidicola]
MRHLPAAMEQLLWLLLLTPALVSPHLALLLAAAAVPSMAQSQVSDARPSCPSTCGDVEIPYPFGISNSCSLPGSDDFTIRCDESTGKPKPYVGNIEIVNISLETGEMRVYTAVSYICYNSTDTVESRGEDSWTLAGKYLISPTRNEFTAIGCNTLAYLQGREDGSYITGCITSCASVEEAANDGDDCTGLGCCQTHISSNLSTMDVNWGDDDNNNYAWPYSPCSYAFVAEEGWYNFSRRDLIRDGSESFLSRVGDETVPLILDWAIKSYGSCGAASTGNLTAPACVSAHSFCANATKGDDGYLCKCSEGYSGNPYITGGCTNINECELLKSDPTKYRKYHCGSSSTCHDIEGDYMCKCKFGHKGDGKSNEGCQPILPGYVTAILAFVAAVLLVFLLCFLHKEHKRRLQRGFSDKNGDEILKRMNIRTFTEEELEKITNRYSRLIGKGNFGTVFMGTTKDSELVAVKCPNKESMKPLEGGEFVNEITFQFKIKHENLVRLVGCCLETFVPRLVFEFIPNGSLYDMLHVGDTKRELSLPDRLNIAIGSAEAVAYMHSHGDNNHVHGDIKSANILLDNDLKPKVSDFGSSKLLSINNYARYVAADGSYIDPVYNKTGRFTVKSDVYSFGVVLLELITRKMPRYGDNSLTIDFEKCCKLQGNGRGMYDAELFCDDNAELSHRYMECLDMVGRLVVRCLNGDSDERPTMAEVVEELKKVKLTAYDDSFI